MTSEVHGPAILRDKAGVEAPISQVREEGATCGECHGIVVIMGTHDLPPDRASVGDNLYCYGCGAGLHVTADEEGSESNET